MTRSGQYMQTAVLAGTIPLINLWADMLRSGSLDQEEPTLNAGDVLLAIQKALVLSRNAASYIFRIRRDQILMHFDPNLSSILRKLLQTKYKNQSEGDQLFGDSIMSKLANRVDALNSLNKLAQKAKPASALRNKEQGLPQRPRAQLFFRNDSPDRRGVGQGNSSTHMEHGNHRNSFKRQKGSWLKARNSDTVKKARTDTSDHPNKTTKSVDVTSILSSESKLITVGTSDPNCRKPRAPPARLAEDNQRSMGTGGNPRLQDTVCIIPTHPTESPQTPLYDTGKGKGSSAESGESNDKRGHQGDEASRGLHQQCTHSSKERRGVETNHRSQDLEQLCHSPTFQDGGAPDVEGSVGTKPLDGKSRLKGCLSYSSNSPQPHGLPEIFLEGKGLQVCMPSIQTSISSQNIHKDPKASRQFPEESRSEDVSIHRRYFGS